MFIWIVCHTTSGKTAFNHRIFVPKIFSDNVSHWRWNLVANILTTKRLWACNMTPNCHSHFRWLIIPGELPTKVSATKLSSHQTATKIRGQFFDTISFSVIFVIKKSITEIYHQILLTKNWIWAKKRGEGGGGGWGALVSTT